MNCFKNETTYSMHTSHWWHCSSGTAKKREKGKEEFVEKGGTTSHEHILVNKVHKFSYCTATAQNMSQKKAS